MTLKWDQRTKDQWFRRLNKMAPTAQAYLEEASGKSAKEMQQMARSLAPVRTGALRDSIATTPPGGSPPKYSQNAMPRVPDGAWAISAGNEQVRYAHLVEFGTAPHEQGGMFEGTAHPGTRARPFFWPAYRTIRKRHRSRVSRALNKSIKDAGK